MLSLYSQDDGGPEVIEALLEKGADPNIQDSEGNSAIHHASGNNHGDVLEILLKSKKSLINLENNERGNNKIDSALLIFVHFRNSSSCCNSWESNVVIPAST